MDDDDGDGKVDAADQTVNGANDEKDLARIRVKIPADALAKAKSVSATVIAGASQVHLFEKTASGWKTANGALSQTAADMELGIEGVQFAGSGWDGFASVRLDVADAQGASLGSQTIKMRVAPWIMLPNSAKTELVYVSSTTRNMRPGIDAVLTKLNLPACKASSPPSQDVWFQDTMEMGYTQVPGLPPMHVVMNAVRGNSADNLAPTLLAPDIGLITVAKTRNLSGEDHWMDWMGDLEVTAPVPGYPLGRIYYGKSPRTTFHPDIVKFLEAQEVQKPFAVNSGWLVIQHVDEIFTFVPDKDGKGKMVIASPEAASKVTPAGYDAGNQQLQGIINEIIKSAKAELGIADSDIIPLPAYFSGNGTDFAPIWSSPVNFIHVNGTIIAGDTEMPAAIKSDIEKKLTALGLQVAWVDDSEYHSGGGNVHCGSNTKKTPVCANFADCL
jgi:protein-arginine deiminase